MNADEIQRGDPYICRGSSLAGETGAGLRIRAEEDG